MENSRYIVRGKIEDILENDVLNVVDKNCGSFIIFEGRVRADEVDDSEVEKIIYESYIEMAEREIAKIESVAIEKFSVKKVIIKHRVGEVKVGEIALLVAVLSEHRKEGFEAIQYVIDEIKRRVPIWKKEILKNGKQRWVEGEND
jgi:molybdopterin synthase catalytic subunit